MGQPHPERGQQVERRLTAILAADVVGYSRLMGADEEGTLARLKACRRELVEPKIATHRGRTIKLMGDGALVEFPSVVEAVECAVEIQAAMGERNADVPPERRIEFRIGINLGDVIVDGSDIYGDGVNVAARLEGLAEPGGICISRTVRNQVRDRLPYPFEDRGEQAVKNIARPVRAYGLSATAIAALPKLEERGTRRPANRHGRRGFIALATVGLAALLAAVGGAWWFWPSVRPAVPVSQSTPAPTTASASSAEASALPLPDKPSIAVLPFTNFSGDAKQERLADGLTEDIITDLARFRDLFVIARNSSFWYKGKPVDVRQVARELGVRYVLEGSLQTAGETVRITAQLIDAITGAHLWSERYDRPSANVFTVQDEVTESIAGTLAGYGTLAKAGQAVAHRKLPENLQAYDYYMLGVEHWTRFTREDNPKAQAFLLKAIALDPSLARAYVTLARTYTADYGLGISSNIPETLNKAHAAAQRAVELDPSDSEAHAVLGALFAFHNEYAPAAAEFERSLGLNPNNADALLVYAGNLAYMGRPQEGVEMADRAVRINPHYPNFYIGYLSLAYLNGGRYEQALAVLRRQSVTSMGRGNLLRLAMSYAQLGQEAEAAAAAAELRRRFPGWSAEKYLSDTGTVANLADLEHYLGGIRKAALRECKTEEELQKWPMVSRLSSCEQQRGQK